MCVWEGMKEYNSNATQTRADTKRHIRTHAHTHTHTHTLLALANNAPVIWMEDTAMARSVSFRTIW